VSIVAAIDWPWLFVVIVVVVDEARSGVARCTLGIGTSSKKLYYTGKSKTQRQIIHMGQPEILAAAVTHLANHVILTQQLQDYHFVVQHLNNRIQISFYCDE
jgi:hypothetical protein